MPKGFFSQGVTLLTDATVSLAEVTSALEMHGYCVDDESAGASAESWCFGGPSVLVPYRPEVNGSVLVDVVDHRWPDAMGDPKSDPTIFGAWSMGHFGPFAFPGSFERARQHAWTWPDGRTIAPTHRGFIRVRSTYLAGADDNALVLPEDYDPLPELLFINGLVVALAGVSGVMCYFNPNGEVLRDLSSFRSICDACDVQQQIPLLLWTNARLFKLDDEFGLMDTVGNLQLDVDDVEAIYPNEEYDPNTIENYLRNVTHYLLDLDREISTGETFDGPGESDLAWVAEVCQEGALTPPRKVLRLCPQVSQEGIRRALAAV
ncbi:MAG TPA: DUF4261 domain-containing protein [Pirellulales bacterium]|nr:DUF4261 domain-containing protein [Pirellulales bacterium]